MDVTELNKEQFAELKESYFYQLMDNDDEVLFPINHIEEVNATCPEDIPDEVIIEHYSGINIFVNDDFFCTMGK